MSKINFTIEELLKKLEGSSNLTIADINDLERFLTKYRLKTRYTNAVNNSFNHIPDVGDQIFELESAVIGRKCLFSCWMDWSLNSDDNWEYIHSLWLDFK